MKTAQITARSPLEVAREVEALLRSGCDRFVLRPLDGGGMLDRERLGAARYAAGLQVEVELVGQSLPAGTSEPSGVETPEPAGAR